jgi:hypothetical protein
VTASQLHSQGIYTYTIEADPEPDVLARVANLFLLGNMAPLNANLRRAPEGLVIISIEIGPMESNSAEMIRRKIAQLTCVSDVVLAESHPPRSVSGTTRCN